MNKKRIAIIVSSFILVIMIIIVTCLLTQCGGDNNAESSRTDTESSVMAQESSKTKDESSKANAKDESSKTNTKDESSKTNTKDESSKTSSTESSKTTSNNSSNPTSNESSKPAQGGNTGATGNTSSNSGSTTQGCSHNWQPVYTTVHHDAVTHQEKVQTGTKTVEDTPAWDENVVVGEQAYIHFGDGTDWDYDPNNITEEFEDQVSIYMSEHHVGYSVMSRDIYEVVHHEAITHEEPIYETKTVTDQAAYDEQVITGYKCSKCGASK